jgi:hypothetical protein
MARLDRQDDADARSAIAFTERVTMALREYAPRRSHDEHDVSAHVHGRKRFPVPLERLIAQIERRQ